MKKHFTQDEIKVFKTSKFLKVKPDPAVDYIQFCKKLPNHGFLNNARLVIDTDHIELWAKPHKAGSTVNDVMINLWKYNTANLLKVLNLFSIRLEE